MVGNKLANWIGEMILAHQHYTACAQHKIYGVRPITYIGLTHVSCVVHNNITQQYFSVWIEQARKARGS
jgi:hypothetical protein